MVKEIFGALDPTDELLRITPKPHSLLEHWQIGYISDGSTGII